MVYIYVCGCKTLFIVLLSLLTGMCPFEGLCSQCTTGPRAQAEPPAAPTTVTAVMTPEVPQPAQRPATRAAAKAALAAARLAAHDARCQFFASGNVAELLVTAANVCKYITAEAWARANTALARLDVDERANDAADAAVAAAKAALDMTPSSSSPHRRHRRRRRQHRRERSRSRDDSHRSHRRHR